MDLMTATNYKHQLIELIPPGEAWPAEDPVLGAVLDTVANQLTKLHASSIGLLEETDPRTTMQLLDDWEEFAGLPDECTINFTGSLQERKAALWQRIVTPGGQSVGMFQNIAAKLGYDVEIVPYLAPFICGESRCGDELNGDHDTRYIWIVNVRGPRVTRFRAGESVAGERLGTIARAEDLECIFNRLKPAHAVLWFIYEE